MWKCTKCNLEISTNVTYPVYCSCGWIDYGNGKVIEKSTQPNMLQKAQNFGQAVARHAQNRFINVAQNIKEERLKICEGCEFYNKTNPDNPTCNKCGCFLKIKTGWASEKCPIGKWSDIKTQASGGCGCNKKQNNQNQ